MKELTLLADSRAPLAFHLETSAAVAHWNLRDVPGEHISVPALCDARLTEIRREHAAWACRTGLRPVEGALLHEHFQAGEKLSMWWCSLLYERHPKMTPLLYEVYKLRTLEHLLDEGGFTALRLVGGDDRLCGTLLALCQATGRQFADYHDPQCRDGRRRTWLRRLYEACPSLLRAAGRYVHWWFRVRLPLRPRGGALPALPPAHVTTGTIVTYFPNVDMEAAAAGRFRSRYWEGLHDALCAAAARTPVRWLFIRFPSPQMDLAGCIRMRDRFRAAHQDGVSFHYLEEFLTAADLRAAWKRYLRLAWTSRRLEAAMRGLCRFEGSRLDFWPYMADDWAETFRGWRCLERCLQQRGIDNYVKAAGPQRWFTFPLENCPWERMLTHAAHTTPGAGGPVYGAQHSTIRPTDFRYFDDPATFTDSACAAFQPDRICANGQGALRQWQAAGVPQERLELVEALRYMYLADARNAAVPAQEGQPPRRLLVVTGFFADETADHVRLLARAVHAGLLDGWEIVVKPHPYLAVEADLRHELGARAGCLRFAEGPVATLLVPGTVVWSSASTTVVLEAALKKLPVMVMLPSDGFDLCPLQDVPGLLRTGNLDDVRRALACAAPPALPDDYLELQPGLPRWRALLEL